MKTSAAFLLAAAVGALAAPAPGGKSGSVEVVTSETTTTTVVKYVKYCYESKCDFYYKDHGYNYYECDDCKEKVKEDKECKVVEECKDNCDFYYKHHGWKFDDYKFGCDTCGPKKEKKPYWGPEGKKHKEY